MVGNRPRVRVPLPVEGPTGFLPGRPDGTTSIADVVFTPTADDGRLTIAITAPSRRRSTPANDDVVDDVLEFIETNPGANTRAICSGVMGHGRDTVANTIGHLVESEQVRLEEDGRSHRHYINQ